MGRWSIWYEPMRVDLSESDQGLLYLRFGELDCFLELLVGEFLHELSLLRLDLSHIGIVQISGLIHWKTPGELAIFMTSIRRQPIC